MKTGRVLKFVPGSWCKCGEMQSTSNYYVLNLLPLFGNMTIIDNILAYHDPIAILALVVSVVAIFFSFLEYLLQREQWHLSVKPLGNIEIYDKAPSELSIIICNSGLGPMRFLSMVTEDKHGVKKEHPADWINAALEAQDKTLATQGIFKSFRKGDHIKSASDEFIVNYDFKSNTGSDQTTKVREIKWIRNVLKDLTIRVKYTDIYDREQPEIVQSLEGFGAT